MNTLAQILNYINSHQEPKCNEVRDLHTAIHALSPNCKLWFLDGKDEHGKVIANPNIGYGIQTLTYANGSTKEFYKIGLSVNKSGISVYIIGLKDKMYLTNTFKDSIGKATLTGYCIKFKSLKDIHLDVLLSAIKYGFDYCV